MSGFDRDAIYADKQVRDTDTHDSVVSKTGEFKAKTLVIKNRTNQQVTLLLQGGVGTTWFNIGSSFNLAATANVYKTISDYFPKYRVKANYEISPTTGGLDAWILKTT